MPPALRDAKVSLMDLRQLAMDSRALIFQEWAKIAEAVEPKKKGLRKPEDPRAAEEKALDEALKAAITNYTQKLEDEAKNLLREANKIPA